MDFPHCHDVAGRAKRLLRRAEQCAVETLWLGVRVNEEYIHDRIIVSIILNRLTALSACG
jgi:hypothetical protein